MTDKKAIEQIFSSLGAYLHQDALLDSHLEDVLGEWINQLLPLQQKVLFQIVDQWLMADADAVSIKSLIRHAAPNWNIPERKLKTAFLKVKDRRKHD